MCVYGRVNVEPEFELLPSLRMEAEEIRSPNMQSPRLPTPREMLPADGLQTDSWQADGRQADGQQADFRIEAGLLPSKPQRRRSLIVVAIIDLLRGSRYIKRSSDMAVKDFVIFN